MSFPNVGPGEEIDVGTGFKLNLLEKRLTIDLGYVRYLFPGYAADLGYEYGDWSAKVDYDFGPFIASARVRYSPDTVLHAGHAWNKRGLVTVWMVQHAGFPGNGGQARGAFEKAAIAAYGK